MNSPVIGYEFWRGRTIKLFFPSHFTIIYSWNRFFAFERERLRERQFHLILYDIPYSIELYKDRESLFETIPSNRWIAVNKRNEYGNVGHGVASSRYKIMNDLDLEFFIRLTIGWNSLIGNYSVKEWVPLSLESSLWFGEKKLRKWRNR